jgi:predicted RNase H-like HicB family nuclease
MRELRPENLILRCYAHRTDKHNWVAVCLELNLAVEADSVEALREKMSDAIEGYIETLLDTNDPASIPELLHRRAPFLDWIKYYLIRLIIRIKRLSRRLVVYKQSIPFHLAHSC